MWSGLLPPGLNESDVDLSSDDGNELPDSSSKEEAREDTKRVQFSEFQESGPESKSGTEPTVESVADGGKDSQQCPSGVPLHVWNKFLELQKKNQEMKAQAHTEIRHRKRKRRRKGVVSNSRIYLLKMELQLVNEDKWKELTQYFGINDRFESPFDSRASQKSGLELSIEKSLAEGDIDKAEELSDRLATREVSGLLTEAL
ncbi:F204A protein, partial [Upupa epops]|nr:F204A protein [Upupa epops]